MNSSVVPAVLPRRAGQRDELVADAAFDGTGAAVAVGVRGSPSEDENPSAPASNASWSKRTIAAICSSVARGGRGVAHRDAAQRGVAGEEVRVDASVPSNRSSHSPKDRQSHAGPALQRVEGHALDAAIIRMTYRRRRLAERRDREAAVAADHRRHTVQRGRRRAGSQSSCAS